MARMKRILITGAGGQIGSELAGLLRARYGEDNVIATDLRAVPGAGPFELLDVTDGRAVYDIAARWRVDTIIHLAALLSATGEADPLKAWRINMEGLLNVLETARSLGCAVFAPSSIAAFGPSTPKASTPQVTVQRPSTIYGISKLAGELLGDYYYAKYGVDTRSLRFPGLVSYRTLPGGGTTDYAVEMYIAAARQAAYTSYIAEGTYLDMMYMPDALESIVALMEADPGKLNHRNGYNVSAMSVDPSAIASAIRRHIPGFTMLSQPDPVRQAIADSWPDAIDTSAAQEEWGFRPRYNLAAMTADMLHHLGWQAGRPGA